MFCFFWTSPVEENDEDIKETPAKKAKTSQEDKASAQEDKKAAIEEKKAAAANKKATKSVANWRSKRFFFHMKVVFFW